MYSIWEKFPSFSCFFRTSLTVLLSPKDFFTDIREGEGVSLTLLFGVIANTTGGLLGLIWLVLFQREAINGVNFPSNFLLVYSLLLPLLSAFGILVTSVLFHLFLLIFRGANKGFKVTLKAISYAQASQLLNAVPLLGPIFATIYGLIVYVIALKEAHGTDYLKAFLSVLIPLFLSVCLFLIGLYSIVSPLGRLWGGRFVF